MIFYPRKDSGQRKDIEIECLYKPQTIDCNAHVAHTGCGRITHSTPSFSAEIAAVRLLSENNSLIMARTRP